MPHKADKRGGLVSQLKVTLLCLISDQYPC